MITPIFSKHPALLMTLCALALPALPACSGGAATAEAPDPEPRITISKPVMGELVKSTRVTVRGNAQNTDMVMVNGKPTSVVGTAWEAQVTLGEGEVSVEVEARGVKESVGFKVDASGPLISISSPQRAQYVDASQGSTVTVSGKASDAVSGIALFKVDERILELGPDGAFTLEYPLKPGLNDITLTAIDDAGHQENAIIGVMHGEFVDPASPIEQAFGIELTQDVFVTLAEVVKGLLTPERVQALVTQNLPLEGVSISRVDFAPVAIRATPRSNPLDASAPGFIDFEVVLSKAEIDGTFELSGNQIELAVKLDRATITTTMRVSADGEGSLDVEFADSMLDLPDGALTWDVKSGGAELNNQDSNLLSGIVEDIARLAFSQFLSEQIIEQLYDPAILTRSIEVLGRTMTFTLDIQDIITNSSGMYIDADVLMGGEKFAAVPDVPGALSRPRGIPETSMLSSDAIATSHRTVIERLLHGVWRSGLLNQSLVGNDFAGIELPVKLEAGALALLLDGQVTNHAENSSPAGLTLRPQLPPILELRPGEGQSALVVRLSELHMDLMLDVDKPQPKKLLTLAMFVELVVNLKIEGTTVSFDFEVKGRADLVDEPLFDLEDEQAEKLLNTLFLLAPQALSKALSVGGEADLTWLKVTNPQVKVHGLEQDQVSIGMDIIANPAGLEPATP